MRRTFPVFVTCPLTCRFAGRMGKKPASQGGGTNWWVPLIIAVSSSLITTAILAVVHHIRVGWS